MNSKTWKFDEYPNTEGLGSPEKKKKKIPDPFHHLQTKMKQQLIEGGILLPQSTGRCQMREFENTEELTNYF